MPQIAEILDFHGLTSKDVAAEAIEKASDSKIIEIAQSIDDALRYDFDNGSADIVDSLAPFRFIASSSVRGDSGCSRVKCRTAKLDSFGRYAALYCDEVVVPIEFHWGHGMEAFRDSLASGVLTLTALRPVIDAGIVRPIVPRLCRKCFEGRADIADVRSAADCLAEHYYDKFSIFGCGLLDGKAVIRVQGPPDFIEHGRMFTVFREMPEWYPEVLKTEANLRSEVPLDRSIVLSSQQIEGVFRKIAMDVIRQTIYGDRLHSKLNYLMGSPGEAEFLSFTKQGRERAMETAALAKRLSHEIPVFSEVPIQRIVDLRRQDRDAFVMYRDALKQVIQEYLDAGGGITGEDAQQLHGDILAPRLARLRAEADAYQSSLSRKSVLKAGISVALLTLGVVGGFLPQNISDLIKAVGGFSVTKEVVESIGIAKETSSAIRANDFYFLLQLSEASRS